MQVTWHWVVYAFNIYIFWVYFKNLKLCKTKDNKGALRKILQKQISKQKHPPNHSKKIEIILLIITNFHTQRLSASKNKGRNCLVQELCGKAISPSPLLLSQLVEMTAWGNTAEEETCWPLRPHWDNPQGQVWKRGTGLYPTHPARLHGFEDYEILANFKNFVSLLLFQTSILPWRIFPQKLI